MSEASIVAICETVKSLAVMAFFAFVTWISLRSLR